MTNENVAQLRIGALFVTVTAALGGLMTGSLSPLRTRNTNFGPSRMGIGTDFVGESQMKSTSGNRSKRMVLGKRRMSELFLGLLLAALARLAFADCRLNDGQVIYPQTYPLSSVTYAVQYQIDGGSWTTPMVYISFYGATTGSPFRNVSGYTAGTTSMSFTSIPVHAKALVRLRVTKLFGTPTPFQMSDHVSVRPSVKPIAVHTDGDGTVEISTFTTADFAGEQFVLAWNRGTDGGGVEGLAFFLNPPYVEPAGTNVQVVTTPADLLDSYPSNIDTLDFEGQVAIQTTGNKVYSVPSGITNVFLGPNAWVQGKLQFPASTSTTKVYGPGVLDGSLFDYERRDCSDDNGTYSLSSADTSGNLNYFIVDGIIVSDHNHGATDPFFNSILNNVKTISWNSNNDGLRLKDSTTVSNVFVRSGDDSLMIWGSDDTVTNATVWQNYNGGVVNLGWLNSSPGDGDLVDGLYVVKTDWLTPVSNDWTALLPSDSGSTLNGQNNAVFASLMVPTTSFGSNSPPVFRNIFVEDQPRVLFSLKIVPPVNCPTTGTVIGTVCGATSIMDSSYMALNIENLYSPVSLVQNSIGFESLPANYVTQTDETIANAFTLIGKINVNLTNIFIRENGGFVVPLLGFDGAYVGNVSTHGDDVNVKYGLQLP
jgi:hypothetical protein